jgi:hypothetical protein
MGEAIKLIENGAIDVSVLISHIGGLNCAARATLELPSIPGAKKLIYCNIDLPLTAIGDFGREGGKNPLYAGLYEICAGNHMLWCGEAEEYLLANAPSI